MDTQKSYRDMREIPAVPRRGDTGMTMNDAVADLGLKRGSLSASPASISPPPGLPRML
jgi:hypothetical protein